MKNEFLYDVDIMEVRRRAEELRTESIRSWMSGFRKRMSLRR